MLLPYLDLQTHTHVHLLVAVYTTGYYRVILFINEKSAQRRRKHCMLAVCSKAELKNFHPATDPLLGGAGRPKFNQLEIFTAFKGRVERIFFFASFKLPLFNEYEMVFIIA